MRFLKSIAVLFFIGFFFYSFQTEIKDFSEKILDKIPSKTTKEIKVVFEDIKENIVSAPDPLIRRGSGNSAGRNEISVLTVSGVLTFTNSERVNANLQNLSLNAKLSEAALNKANDILAKGYFEHVSPQGEGPADLAKEAGYSYIAIGENLALGDFENDKDLVDAWMASPGHRANILGKHFTEIGIAVKKGFYEGRMQWVAVQEFGTPASLCEKPSSSEQREMEKIGEIMLSIKSEIDNLRETIDKTDKNSKEYNELVASYNSLVSEYNKKVRETEDLVNAYNNKIKAYNACLKNYTE